jgi:hypothetical protein
MSSAAYIDPGVEQSACALFTSGVLEGVLFVTPAALVGFDRGDLYAAVIENPRISGQTRGKDPNDLMDLAVVVGDLRGVIRARCGVEAELVAPVSWKGNEVKPIHHSRVWAALAPAERLTLADCIGWTPEEVEAKIEEACQKYAQLGRVVGYSWRAHNLLDAVGLGLWGLKRVGRAGARLNYAT